MQANSDLLEEFIGEAEAAKRLGNLPVTTLQRWRHEGKGPAYHRFGKRVLYAMRDICAYVEASRRGGEAE
jgi:Helix-turn-helix domain